MLFSFSFSYDIVLFIIKEIKVSALGSAWKGPYKDVSPEDMFVRGRLKVKRAANMSTTKRFQLLTTLMDNELDASAAPETAKIIKKVKLPPIMFRILSREVIIAIINELGIKDFNIKLMSIGTRLFIDGEK